MDLDVIRAAPAADHPSDPRVFGSADVEPDPQAMALLREGVRDADLAAPPVVLPDFYHKDNMEMPSSMAVATRETIRPTLTSVALNCGMALIAFDMDRPGPRAIEEFYRLVRRRYPWPPRWRFELSAREVLRTAVEGARFAVDRFEMDPQDLTRAEEGGCLDTEPFGGAERVRRELPGMAVALSRLRFGTVGPNTHFVELEEVEEILDPEAAERMGVHLGQVMLQYHAGGGVLASQLGGLYFGRRKGNGRSLRLEMSVQRPLHHLASARSLRELRERFRTYLGGPTTAVPRSGREGERLMLANAVAMNYGFAFRMATYANLRAMARRAFGSLGARLIVDSPHNSIYDEEVDGEPAIVHRHNSARAFPASRMAGHPVFGHTGQAVLVPGISRTSSFLGAANEGAHRSLHSACHGSGSIIDRFVRQELSGPDPLGRRTLRFRYGGTAPEEVAHLDDRGVDEAMAILSRNDLARPVARLRPFAVLT